jgi:4'-phosphopantetheinyl transferase
MLLTAPTMQNVGARRLTMGGEKMVTISVWPLAVSAARLAALKSVLSDDEKERAGRFKLETAAREFVISRGITRELLAAACGCTATEIVLTIGPRGKPRLVIPPSPLTFNLSHSSGYCALAVGAVSAIGVDIEALRDTVGDVAKNVFSVREAEHYATVAPADRTRVFFRGWVAKEAYLKATGEGLGGGLKSLELDPTANTDIRPLAIGGDQTAPRAWCFHGFDVTDSIVGAIAIKTDGQDFEVQIRRIDAEKTSTSARASLLGPRT